MSKIRIIRWTGITVVIAAITLLANQFIQDTPLILYAVVLIGSLAGFIGIHLYQKDQAGPLSIISLLVLLLTFVFYGTGRDDLGDIVFPLSFLLLGFASYRSGKFPRWAAFAVILAVMVSLLDSYLFTFPKAVDVTVAFIFAAGYGALGLTVWQQPEMK